MHNGKAPVRTDMWMRICLTDTPMRRPAGVGNTDSTTHGRELPLTFDLGKFAGIFAHFEPAIA